jgi:alkanesulfonate monooxygenase SsuD/methylene tetrahydromethanopterin reductase-like flavin-dependent oxidoreductase (luciferase family)
MMKPFRFGVNVWTAGSRAEWADKARKAEELGYDVFTVPDHLAGIFAPMPALMSAAAATKRLRVWDQRAQQRLPPPRAGGA